MADVLLGSSNPKISRWGHDHLSTFGIGQEYTQAQWLSFIRELTQMGYIDIRGTQYPTLGLNERSYDILKGRTSVELTRPPEEEAIPEVQPSEEEFDPATFEFLRAVRKEMAKQENVPPYIIFSDATLKELSVFVPSSVGDLRNVTGIGAAKLQRYGKLVFDLLQRYRRNPDDADALITKIAHSALSD